MVYLRNTTTPQVLKLPKDIPSGRILAFSLMNTIDHEVFSQELEESGDTTLYHSFFVTLPQGLPDGEYRYELKDAGKSISTGLMIIGSQDSFVQNEIETTYKQYESAE